MFHAFLMFAECQKSHPAFTSTVHIHSLVTIASLFAESDASRLAVLGHWLLKYLTEWLLVVSVCHCKLFSFITDVLISFYGVILVLRCVICSCNLHLVI